MHTFGADPEVFLGGKGDTPVSAIGVVGGTKKEPRKTRHGHVQEDNVAAEFNIPPAVTPEEFDSNIEAVLGDLHRIVGEHGLSILRSASEEFPEDQLLHPLALIAGCEPDMNAYTMEENPRPAIESSRLRTAGAHLHIGVDIKSLATAARLVRVLDLFLAIPAVLVEDPRRKELYGQAGAFRMKDYGIEYRTLSNFWVFDSKMRRWVVTQAQRALKAYTKPDFVVPPHLVQGIIDTNSVAMAKKVIEQYALISPEEL